MTTLSTIPLHYPIPEPPVPTKFPLVSPRGAKLATRVWPTNRNLLNILSSTPPSSPKALLLIIHGGGWHSGYFDGLGTYLRKAGIFCAAYDQAGSGYSEAEPTSPRPDATHVADFDWLVEDVFAAVEWMQLEAAGGGGSPKTNFPIFLLGESFGGIEAIGAAFQMKEYGVDLAGVICLGGLLKVGDQFLPPSPVVSMLCFLARYYPRIIMPATDFGSTFDDAFGDKEWARTARQDPKVKVDITPTIGAVATTLGAGIKLRGKAKEFPTKFYAIHGARDCRTSCPAMQEFVDKMGPEKASIDLIDTDGHQLLQDTPKIVDDIMKKVKGWILEIAGEQNRK